jgi:hypothetical protein
MHGNSQDQQFQVLDRLNSNQLDQVKRIFFDGFYQHYSNEKLLSEEKKYKTTADIYCKYGDDQLKLKLTELINQSIHEIKDQPSSKLDSSIEISLDEFVKNSSREELIKFAKISNEFFSKNPEFDHKKNEAIKVFLRTAMNDLDDLLTEDNQEKILLMTSEDDREKIIGFATFKIFDNSIIDELGNKKIKNGADQIAYICQSSIDPSSASHQRSGFKIANAIANYLSENHVEEMTFVSRIFNEKILYLSEQLDSFSKKNLQQSIFTEAEFEPSVFGYSDKFYTQKGVANIRILQKAISCYFKNLNPQERESTAQAKIENSDENPPRQSIELLTARSASINPNSQNRL